MEKTSIFFQFKYDFSEILALKIFSLIELFFKQEKIFGHISDSMKIARLGFQNLINLLTTKLISRGEYISMKPFLFLENKLYEVIVDVEIRILTLGFFF